MVDAPRFAFTPGERPWTRARDFRQTTDAAHTVAVAATHCVLTPTAWDRLADAGVEELVVSDSVVVPSSRALPTRVVSVAALLARQLGRLSDERRA